nr:CBM_HP1_G0003790.mRNA.1.CDS.1 [Saccharomyces cerevisiae]
MSGKMQTQTDTNAEVLTTDNSIKRNRKKTPNNRKNSQKQKLRKMRCVSHLISGSSCTSPSGPSSSSTPDGDTNESI